MKISDARVLIVATDGFEEWELFGPREILQGRGAEVVLASLTRDPIQAGTHPAPQSRCPLPAPAASSGLRRGEPGACMRRSRITSATDAAAAGHRATRG